MTTAPHKVRVCIIGAGLSGLCLANGLLNDSEKRFEVTVCERDDLTYSSERGGYQIRLGRDGIAGIKGTLAPQAYADLADIWGTELSSSPVFCTPELNVVYDPSKSRSYTQSRAVPRSALKDYLLKVPIAHNALRLSRRLQRVVTQTDYASGISEVICYFEDGSQITCDLLIAADGARSTVNKQMGINNAIPLSDKGIQGRGTITEEQFQSMPETLKKYGSMGVRGSNSGAFVGVYRVPAKFRAKVQAEASSDGATSRMYDGFIFWGTELGEEHDAVMALKTDAEKAEAIATRFEQLGHPSWALPHIIRTAPHNIKPATTTISSPPSPEDWRAGRLPLGRVILVGDAIHPMSPGRGMGANQAMKDAAELTEIMLNEPCFKTRSMQVTDEQMLDMALRFDKTMYKRAFYWVEASSSNGLRDPTTWTGWLSIKVKGIRMTVADIQQGLLETVGLAESKTVSF